MCTNSSPSTAASLSSSLCHNLLKNPLAFLDLGPPERTLRGMCGTVYVACIGDDSVELLVEEAVLPEDREGAMSEVVLDGESLTSEYSIYDERLEAAE